jgi:hypothetical protein
MICCIESYAVGGVGGVGSVGGGGCLDCVVAPWNTSEFYKI